MPKSRMTGTPPPPPAQRIDYLLGKSLTNHLYNLAHYAGCKDRVLTALRAEADTRAHTEVGRELLAILDETSAPEVEQSEAWRRIFNWKRDNS